MSLREHAEYELRKAGLLDKDSDYEGLLGKAALDIIDTFSAQGHSGMSAMMLISILEKLLRYEPLTDLTSDPDEWTQVGGPSDGYPTAEELWQSKRRPSTFSRDGGQTWYDIHDPERNNGDVWERIAWYDYQLGDETVKPGRTIRVKLDAYEPGKGAHVNGKIGRFAGARNGFVYIKYDDATSDDAGAAHRPEKIEVETER